MQAYEVIEAERSRRDLTATELARRISMEYELLRRTLHGNRKLQGEELILLCVELGLQISDFVNANDRKAG